MRITHNGRFEIGHGYKVIVSQYDGENCRIRFGFKESKELLEYNDEDEDHLFPVSEIGKIETFPIPYGWADRDPIFDKSPIICFQEGEGVSWIQKTKESGWHVLPED